MKATRRGFFAGLLAALTLGKVKAAPPRPRWYGVGFYEALAEYPPCQPFALQPYQQAIANAYERRAGRNPLFSADPARIEGDRHVSALMASRPDGKQELLFYSETGSLDHLFEREARRVVEHARQQRRP